MKTTTQKLPILPLTTLSEFKQQLPLGEPASFERIQLAYVPNLAGVAVALREFGYLTWLDSSDCCFDTPSPRGRFDIISAAPEALVWQQQSKNYYWVDEQALLSTDTNRPLVITAEQNIYQLAEQIRQHQHHSNTAYDYIRPFNGGLLGYWGYECNADILPIIHTEQPSITGETSLPNSWQGYYSWALITDHHCQESYLLFCNTHRVLRNRIVNRLLSTAIQPSLSPFSITQAFSPQQTVDEYAAAIKKIHHYLQAGDCYQINYTQQFTGQFKGDPLAAYIELRKVCPVPYSAYIELPTANNKTVNQHSHNAILSLSPERLVRLQHRHADTMPIKGTAPRYQDPDQDRLSANTLLASEKNRAENVMIVDLLRNDLGKIAIPGSVYVSKLFELQSFPNVHHIVSTIEAQLNADNNAIDLMQAIFPGGSITGAPKKRAMEIIAELEPHSRQVYCGSIGYMANNGDSLTNIAIRTLVTLHQQIYCWGGGGIVIDSDIQEEYEESLQKIQLLMTALENITTPLKC